MAWVYITKVQEILNLKVTASEAILKGLAPDGGLFVPSELPKLDVSMSDLKGKSISGDRISRNEAVPDRFYRRRTEKLY